MASMGLKELNRLFEPLTTTYQKKLKRAGAPQVQKRSKSISRSFRTRAETFNLPSMVYSFSSLK
nr:hypothetical protein [Mycoplasma haemofelis]